MKHILKATPFLLFDGECAEAMQFYKSCLGGELSLSKLGDTPMKDAFPPEKHERIINAHLASDGLELTATDWMSAELSPKPGNTMAIYLESADHDRLKDIFGKLAVGANRDVTYQELHDMPFGLYGQLTDKFGIAWIFKGDPN